MSRCTLAAESLRPDERAAILAGRVPLGRVFGKPDGSSMWKTNLAIQVARDPSVAAELRSDGRPCFLKDYDLWVGSRRVAHVTESLCEESICRVCHVNA